MLAKRIPGATRVLGAPPDWNEERDGFCGGLAIKDQPSDGVNYMVSAWEPTPEELARIAEGAPVLLWVCGEIHPAVSITVGRSPEEHRP